MYVVSSAQVETGLLPLLEREAPLGHLSEALAEATAGAGRVVLLSGEAGVGKTALVQRFLEESGENAHVLVGACDPLFTPRPLGPLADIAEAIGGELRELVEAGAIPYRIAAALEEMLDERGPTILVMEDLHWADEATLDVLRLLARRIEDVPALLIATYRDDELDVRHPLLVVLGSLATRRSIRRIRLLSLSPDAVTQLAEPSGANPADLYRKTSGNPFFVTEALAGNPEEEIPGTVRDAVRARISRLSPDACLLLEAVSTVPTGAEPWLLEALVGPIDGELAACLASGVLTTMDDAITFRHELARLTVEETLSPDRRITLHRKALAALEAQPVERHDLARLAHHADAAGDTEAVLRFAPEAAARASSLRAHREAAAQYRRALRHARGLPPEQRAALLERYSDECYLTDEADEAIGSLYQAVECYQELGDRRGEGATLNSAAHILWCPGRGEDARSVGRDAVALLEQLPSGSELANAYDNLAFLHRMNADLSAARAWSDRALALAAQLGDAETLDRVSTGAAFLDVAAGSHERVEEIDRRIDIALRAGLEEDAAHMVLGLALTVAYWSPRMLPRRVLEAGVGSARSTGLDLTHLYLLAFQTRLELDEGRWAEATELSGLVLGERFISTFPRTLALISLALVRARRGDPNVWPVLDEAWALAEPTGELPRIAPVAAARAEAAWLAGRPEAVGDETDAAFRLALERRVPRAVGELALARMRAGIEDDVPEDAQEPYRSQLSGDWKRAAELWAELRCPYEAALALADSSDESALRRSHDELHRLGAKPAAAIVSRRLRALGARDIRRGPRPATRRNAAGLTARESQVLALVAEGLRNSEIAQRLFLSPRTVGNHVSAILSKLGADTRVAAVAKAAALGLLQDK
jgi:DNA-binding CsgD family transcriptional regulator